MTAMKTKFAVLAGAVQVAACNPGAEAMAPQQPVAAINVKCDMPDNLAPRAGVTGRTWLQMNEFSVSAQSSEGTAFVAESKGCAFNAAAEFPVVCTKGTLQDKVTSFTFSAGSMPGDKEITPAMTFVKDGIQSTIPAPKGTTCIVGRQ